MKCEYCNPKDSLWENLGDSLWKNLEKSFEEYFLETLKKEYFIEILENSSKKGG